MTKTEELIAYVSTRDDVCSGCGDSIPKMDFVMPLRPRGVSCLSCAGLDYLVYLPSGNTALTSRARKYSPLSLIVKKFSKSRRRNERQGVLVSAAGLAQAEAECLSDEEQRAQRRERDRIRAEKMDKNYIQAFAVAINNFFPHCPEGRASEIADHACEKYSGRVGRSAGAKEFGERFITMSVIAHIRHTETNYDELLAKCFDRDVAREQVWEKISQCLVRWRSGGEG